MLRLQDIAVTYHNIVPAVQGVSLEVPDKTVVALLGANGAGKTTIIRAISGLLNIHKASIERGTIHFDGERILLDEPVELEPNTRLIVTVLPNHYDERATWLRVSGERLADAYGAEEEGYSLDVIKEANPEYEGT